MPATPQTIQTFHVFLASPGDMKEERKSVRKFFSAYNRDVANRRNLEIKVVDWENYSSIGLGRPQALITHQTLARFKESLVLFIGLLGQRFGTPTGGYESGTEEEFQTAIDFRKQHGDYPEIKWFIREQWGQGELPTDAKALAQATQQKETVEAFIEKLKSGDPAFFTASFATTADFPEILRNDLDRWLNDPQRPWNEGPIPSQAGVSKKPTPEAFNILESKLKTSEADLTLTEKDLRTILEHPVKNAQEYRLARIAEWSQPRYELDKRFTQLTLMLDQGPQAQGPRFAAQEGQRFQDLGEIFDKQPAAPAFVLLGPPGSGKSTLLRRLELDLAKTAILEAEAATDTRLSYYCSLKEFGSEDLGKPPDPMDWLATRWQTTYPRLQPLAELLASRRMVLLLDAINEMPHADFSQYQHLVQRWKGFIRQLERNHRGCRIIFSCRTLEYSATLSTPELTVPHVRIEKLSESQIQAFLRHYAPEHAEVLFREIKASRQLDFYATAYFLMLLTQQSASSSQVPRGRAALFTGFVRALLLKEYQRDNDLILHKDLLARRDLMKLTQPQWATPYELPENGPLFPQLAKLAHSMQDSELHGERKQVSIPYDETLTILGKKAEDLIEAGTALSILDEDRRLDKVQYFHQLLQEYFAARRLKNDADCDRVRIAWRAYEVEPSLEQTLAQIPDYEPLPAPKTTGWEETTLMAAAMSDDPEATVERLMEANLPLAGRAAAQSEVKLSSRLKARIQHALISRMADRHADLRARIAAGQALGELGDPRFEPKLGAHGDYLMPPVVEIEGGLYTMGSDERLYENESPVHEVEIEPFVLGKFPLTHAEWHCFMEADGYENERWWPTEGARAWRRGETTAKGPKQQSWEYKHFLLENYDSIRDWLQQGRITSKQAEEWETIAQMDDDAFEALLEERYPAGRQTQPDFWNDDAYSNPSQPVVGVSWFEALAYCAWLSENTGNRWRLPTEAEWEAAARGRKVRRFAYGDEFDAKRCNTFETHIRATTPIGVFPGETPEGLVDMTGNVWEWTSTLYRPYPYDANDGRENPDDPGGPRVVRGGSWLSLQDGGRAAYRDGFVPAARGRGQGFRLCCSFHIMSAPVVRLRRRRKFRPIKVCRTRPGDLDGAGESRPQSVYPSVGLI